MKKYSFIILITFLSLVSCDEFLSEEPLSQISSNSFFQTESDADVSVSAIYSSIRGYYGGDVFYYGDISTEIANNGEVSSSLNTGEYLPSDPRFRNFWTIMYRTINYANVAIKNIPSVSMDADIRERYVGEARFLRALAYFELVRAFGGVPKITEPTLDESNNNLPRATVDEIYNLIFDDLIYCETVLPATYNAANTGRATSGAAKALMAKVYLQKGDFQNTLSKTKEVMSSGTYELLPHLKDVFDVAKENGPEHIFSIQFLAGFTENLGSQISRTYASRNPEFNLHGVPSWSGIACETKFYNSIPDHYRKRLLLVAEVPTPYYHELDHLGSRPIQAGPACMKFWDPAAGSNVGGDDANWMVLRYADVLLMFAEAENEVNGPTAAAYDAINRIRKRARDENQDGIDDPDEIAELPDLVGLSKDEFRLAVWKERDMELCFEGHHRWDLIRTNRFVEVLNASDIIRQVSDANMLLPIPDLEIFSNPNLVQNPGYK